MGRGEGSYKTFIGGEGKGGRVEGSYTGWRGAYTYTHRCTNKFVRVDEWSEMNTNG